MKSITINFSKVIIVILLFMTTITTLKSQVTYNNDVVTFTPQNNTSFSQNFNITAGTNRMLVLYCVTLKACIVVICFNICFLLLFG